MTTTNYQDIKTSLRQLYLEDERPWLVGFSGGKDSTMLASLIFDALLSIPSDQRVKPISVVCTDTRVEIPAIVGMVERTLEKMQRMKIDPINVFVKQRIGHWSDAILHLGARRAHGLPDDLLNILKDDLDGEPDPNATSC